MCVVFFFPFQTRSKVELLSPPLDRRRCRRRDEGGEEGTKCYAVERQNSSWQRRGKERRGNDGLCCTVKVVDDNKKVGSSFPSGTSAAPSVATHEKERREGRWKEKRLGTGLCLSLSLTSLGAV